MSKSIILFLEALNWICSFMPHWCVLYTEPGCQASVFKVLAFGARSDKPFLLLPGTALILTVCQEHTWQYGTKSRWQQWRWGGGWRTGLVFTPQLLRPWRKEEDTQTPQTAPQTLNRLQDEMPASQLDAFVPFSGKLLISLQDGWVTTRPSLHYLVCRPQSQVGITVKTATCQISPADVSWWRW